MPRPKYRGPYNQAHQDKLSAFSFGDAWRRRKSSATAGSDLSPMGSRLISRRGSAWSRKSNKLGSRQGSEFQGVEEGEGDDDVANGMSTNGIIHSLPADSVRALSGTVETTYGREPKAQDEGQGNGCIAGTQNYQKQ